MSHRQEVTYKVCIYIGSGREYKVIKNCRSYEKANQFLSEYLKNNDFVSRAFIEKSCSYRNNKREMWK